MGTREHFLAAADAFSRLVDEINDDELGREGLGVWSVRDLIGHTSRAVRTVVDYLSTPADHVTVGSPVEYFDVALRDADHAVIAARGVAAGQALGDDPAVAVRALVEEVRQALAAVADTDPVLTTIVGGMRLADYLPTRTFELAVHCDDLARATGRRSTMPDQVLGEAAALAARLAARRGSGGEVLAALTGRGALPEGFGALG